MSDDRDDLPTDRIDDDDFGEEIVGGDQFDTQIADDKFTDVIDNGAMSQIVDRVNQSPFEDDFVAAERVREQSQLGPDGRPVDEFDAKFQQANAEQTALDQQAPFVRTNPVSITKGILGSQVPITAPGVNEGEPIYSERKQIALWGGDDAETTSVTCCFGPVGQPGVTAQSGVQPVGIVKWGTRGFLMEAEIDILLGAQFTVCASYVVLEGMMAGPAGALNTFNFTGMVSTAPCVRTAPLTRTLYW
ncbi:MAG: hypothetical protein Q7R41_11340, partial [Phycisphaerales bacterium]|nr:hypothetical protein [Phycisphaerales bacterium]